jgi:hypothetical protein
LSSFNKSCSAVSIKSFLTNKYGISIIVLLALLSADVLLHRGETRMLISGGSKEKIGPYRLPVSEIKLQPGFSKNVVAVHTIDDILHRNNDDHGIYLQLKWIDKSGYSAAGNALLNYSLDSLISLHTAKQNSGFCIFDVSGINESNQELIYQELKNTEQRFHLRNRILVASDNTKMLQFLHEKGFYPALITPAFDPTIASEEEKKIYCDLLAKQLQENGVDVLITGLKNYSFLRKVFPTQRLITKTGNEDLSLVGYFTKRHLEKDSMVLLTIYEK